MPKVLIAEPDDGVRAVLGESFRASHWTFAEATTGEETIALARTAQPDIILIEPSLPGNGIAVLRHLRADAATCHLPFVVLTGFFHARWERDLWALNAGRILLKPIYPSEIIAELQAALHCAAALLRPEAQAITVVGDLNSFLSGHAAEEGVQSNGNGKGNGHVPIANGNGNANGNAPTANGKQVLKHVVRLLPTDQWPLHLPA